MSSSTTGTVHAASQARGALAGFAILTAATTPAVAFEGPAISAIVHTDHLELNTPEGRREFERRIDRATRLVCRSRMTATGLDYSDCVREARRSARLANNGHALE